MELEPGRRNQNKQVNAFFWIVFFLVAIGVFALYTYMVVNVLCFMKKVFT